MLQYCSSALGARALAGNPARLRVSRAADVFAVDVILDITPEERTELQEPASRLVDLLDRVDLIESPKIAEWQLRCSACLARIESVLEQCSSERTETTP